MTQCACAPDILKRLISNIIPHSYAFLLLHLMLFSSFLTSLPVNALSKRLVFTAVVKLKRSLDARVKLWGQRGQRRRRWQAKSLTRGANCYQHMDHHKLQSTAAAASGVSRRRERMRRRYTLLKRRREEQYLKLALGQPWV